MRSFSSPVNLHFAVIINICSSASLQTGTRLRRKKTAASLLTVLVHAIKKHRAYVLQIHGYNNLHISNSSNKCIRRTFSRPSADFRPEKERLIAG